MSEAKHTSPPWASEHDETGHWRVYGGDKLVADVGNAENNMAADIEWKANAALIVRAVNAHDDLVKALMECRIAMWADNPADGWKEIIEGADAALAKAEAA
jgi:hypothetical protein